MTEDDHSVPEIPDDPKFEKTVRLQVQFIMNAWNIGDFRAAGRALDGLVDLLWSFCSIEAQKKFSESVFTVKTAKNLYTEDDWRRIKIYGNVPKKRQREIQSQLISHNKHGFYNCRRQQLRYLSFILKSLNLMFRKDGSLYDDGESDIDESQDEIVKKK